MKRQTEPKRQPTTGCKHCADRHEFWPPAMFTITNPEILLCLRAPFFVMSRPLSDCRWCVRVPFAGRRLDQGSWGGRGTRSL